MQLSFQHPDKKEMLLNGLSKHLSNISDIVLTNNRSRILLIKQIHKNLSIRIHKGFADAEDNIIHELANFIKKPNKISSNIIQNYFNKCIKIAEQNKTTKKRIIKHHGSVYNLKELFDSINQTYFLNKLNINITWGYTRKRNNKFWAKSRHITLGQYNDSENLIIIHPNLDRKRVPSFFIESVIFHEICHHLAKSHTKNIRRSIHTKEFKDLEKKYPRLIDAKTWEKENFSYLIRNIPIR